MSVLVLDNYDSFTYNLVHLVEKVCDEKVEVFQNDKISLKEINKYDKIILSPGFGLPKDAGVLLDVIKTYSHTKRILGVCLGLQAIGENFGASLKNLDTVFHGVRTPIQVIKEDNLFQNIPNSFYVGRYHSWVIDEVNLPECLDVLALDEQKRIMALRHKIFNIKGVQFHPESILSEFGEQLIRNWIYN